MVVWWVREWAGIWMLGFITTSLKLTQPSTSMEKSRSQAYKGAGVDQEEEKENSMKVLMNFEPFLQS